MHPRKESPMTPGSILLFVHPPFYKAEGQIFFDAQAQNGLRLWAANFDLVRLMAPLDEMALKDVPSDAKPLQPFLDAHPSVEPIMMPRRGMKRFLLQDRTPGRKIIADKINASQYLVFGFSGYIGDWGTEATRIATAMGRPYAVFKDGVAHRVARITQAKMQRSVLRRARDDFENWVMKTRDQRTVRGSALALLHGQDTMEYYGALASTPKLVHNIHISKADRISEAALTTRLDTRDESALKIAYAGRVEEIKGPDHWAAAIQQVRDQGVAITAKWYGTGTLFDEHQAKIASSDLARIITFTGFMAHKDMLPELHRADLFLFTHLTEESPRCLIEALSAGLPLVGYDSAYARDLVGDSQAGLFVPREDTGALAAALKTLAEDPQRLRAMAEDARRIAEPLNDEDVFRARGELIKEAFGPALA